MNADGKNRRKIADHAREPFWSADGKVIGYLPQEYPKFDVIDYYTKGMVYYHLDTGDAEPHPNSEKLRHLYHPRFAPEWQVDRINRSRRHGVRPCHPGHRGPWRQDRQFQHPGLPAHGQPRWQHIAWGSERPRVDHRARYDYGRHAHRRKAGTAHQGQEEQDLPHCLVARWQVCRLQPRARMAKATSPRPAHSRPPAKSSAFMPRNWNLCAVSAEHGGVIDLEKPPKAICCD